MCVSFRYQRDGLSPGEILPALVLAICGIASEGVGEISASSHFDTNEMDSETARFYAASDFG